MLSFIQGTNRARKKKKGENLFSKDFVITEWKWLVGAGKHISYYKEDKVTKTQKD